MRYPDAIFNYDDLPLEPEAVTNVRNAGFQIVEIVEQSGFRHIITYPVEDTPQTRIYNILADYEVEGKLLRGARHNAIVDLMAGTFDEYWSHFYPRLQG